jgi:uncharacterized YccA/Bax inhibitor family protein
VRSSNPVLTRLTPETQYGRPQSASYPTYPAQSSGVVFAGESERMTIDDVVVRTVSLLLITAATGAAAWAIVPDALVIPAWIGAALIGLVIGLVISFKRITSPPLILTYAVVEGVFVGLVSKFFESYYSGIVVQAAIGTFGIFLVMTALYKFGAIRNSPRFTRGVTAAVIGVLFLMLGNFVLNLFGINPGLRSGGTLAIVFSIVVIVVASLTFILDFDLIEKSVQAGAPKSMAWTCAFGLLVGLIWVYLEVLRLLSYLRGRN